LAHPFPVDLIVFPFIQTLSHSLRIPLIKIKYAVGIPSGNISCPAKGRKKGRLADTVVSVYILFHRPMKA